MPRGAPISKEQKSARRKAARDARTLAGRCYQCNAGLLDEDKRARVRLCFECREARDAASARHDQANPGRNRFGEAGRRPPTEHEKEERRAHLRAQALADKLAGICTHMSCKLDALEDSNLCERHRDMDRRGGLRHYRKKTWPRVLANNILMGVGIQPRRAKKSSSYNRVDVQLRLVTDERHASVTSDAGRVTVVTKKDRYTPIDEVLARSSVRVMRALARCDWATSREVMDACDIENDDELAYLKQLERFAKNGKLERRKAAIGQSIGGGACTFEYRITDAGREYLREVLE